ncbi:hypothetical protein ABPG77_010973 [Micractinium sp. CCAP 211/92]
MSGPSLAARAGAEMLGSLMTCCLALGAVANALLPRTKGEGMGLLAIALAVGLAIGLPIACFWQVSAFFNPSILLAQAVRGRVGGAGPFFALLAAELVGWFAGALVLYVIYLPHLNAAVALPAADEVDRLLRDPAALSGVALVNASYTLGAPAVTSPRSFWRFAAQDARRELHKAWHARKLADPFRTCPEELADACDAANFSAEQHSAQAQAQQQQQQPALGKEPAAGLEGVKGVGDPGALWQAEGGGLHRRARPVDKGSEAGGGQAAAPTYAQRLRREGGEAGSRGQLAATLAKARQDILLSVFVTRPAVWSPLFNFLQELVATSIMATAALLLFEQGTFMDGPARSAWPPQAALLVGLLNASAVLALGGGTGPAMNPARDLMPRIAFHLLPIPGKGCSEWHYGWIPVAAGLAGGAIAGGLVSAILQLLAWNQRA